MISSKNLASYHGLDRHYGSLMRRSRPSRGVEVLKVYTRTRKRKEVENREEGELKVLVRSPAVKRVRVAVKRICEDCRTTITPLWRRGPNGRQTLCNACGIRYRKKRGLQLNCDQSNESSSSSSSSCSSPTEGLSYEELKQRQKEKQMKMLFLLGWNKNKNMNNDKMMMIEAKTTVAGGGGERGEAEEAARLLLSLSSGS